MTSAGDLRSEIKLERQVLTPDGAGGSTVEWVEVVTTPARIKYLKGGETVMAGRLQGNQTVVVTLRNQPGLGDADTTWRLTSTRSNRVYDIKAFTLSEDGAWLDILADTGVS
ncbi:phage head closure protein [Bradyrhizobium barranii subsp. apii]|uniref:phage head closure protein n=1 Tax=Bradyrhizobium barranii TaxID=2992140 RepID=UPI001AA0CE7F|nr:phage head closure protein [Bradyrhizobium barranii]UPT93023.1 phage head closure protein [Bradyrhizobium barranii subsp. apii]